ncbi:MAG TPA: extracellular solute-binding protein [Candidatus Limnocylindrales bacterium]|nr:extracellular solute-binding protein [Candidatus Limnocylindrales bacterium]
MATTRSTLPRLAVLGTAIALFAAACANGGATTAPGTGGTGSSGWTPDATLLAAAKAEGQLTTIALPHSWCDYGDMLTQFKAKTGLTINELNPDGGSGDEVNAIKQNQSGGQNAPDVIDVGLSFGPQSVADGILAPYKVSTWETIPASAKDPDGNWYGDYYGVMAFEVNTDVVKNPPADWADLQKADYKNAVALAGDPTVSNQAISAVWAAGIATGGSLDNAQPGLDFFKTLNAAGNFVPVIGKTATVASGETPIRLAWTYNALADNDALKGTPPIKTIVPKSAVFGGMYVQAISKYAPHPNAAKLWMEYLYSDEGQITWMKGYCTPIRYDDLKKRNVIPADVAAKLPDTTGVQLPTLDQINKASDLITKGWAAAVGATVK